MISLLGHCGLKSFSGQACMLKIKLSKQGLATYNTFYINRLTLYIDACADVPQSNDTIVAGTTRRHANTSWLRRQYELPVI